MDDADKANVEIENYLADRIKHGHRSVKNGPKPCGYCHTCYEDVDDNQLFCNRICADQYEVTYRLSRH